MFHPLILPFALLLFTAAPSPSCRDVRDFGARPGDGKDDAPAITL